MSDDGGRTPDRASAAGTSGPAEQSSSEVTREGMRGARPGRQARTGAGGRHRRGQGEVVPEAEFTSYYGKPVLNQPIWEARDIAGYLYLGGLAGASSVLAAGAQLTGRPRLATSTRLGAAGAISLSLAALIHDLGRPGRFLNMLRVFKPTSPMNVGSWLLAGYGPLAGVAALSAVTGVLPRVGRAATLAAGFLGPDVATYTGALIADTAVPAWHDGHREMPYLFAGSGAVAASGLAMLTSPVDEAGPARTSALFGAALEVGTQHLMEHRMGFTAQPYRQGPARRLMRAGEMLAAGGALAGALLGRRSRLAAAASGAALLVGSACTRFGIFRAGQESAKDPRYTVVPQRERLRAAASSQDSDAQQRT